MNLLRSVNWLKLEQPLRQLYRQMGFRLLSFCDV
jgi:hypothetical protein